MEEQLADYEGTIIVVSHDRAFLDNVVTSTLVFEDNGEVLRYPGGYSDWQRQGRHLAAKDEPLVARPTAARRDKEVSVAPHNVASAAPRRLAKLSYKLQSELDPLPAQRDEVAQAMARWDALETMQREAGQA